MEEKKDPKNIQNFSELGEEFNKAKEEAKVAIERDIKAFIELVPQIPKLTAELVRRGIENKIDQLNEVSTKALYDKIALARVVSEKNSQSRQWQNANEGRSGKVTGAVKWVEDKVAEKKSRVSQKAINIASFVGTGLTLFGQKGLANKMQEMVYNQVEKYAGKESKRVKIARRAATFGFKVADSVREGWNTTKDVVKGTASQIKEDAVDFYENAKEKREIAAIEREEKKQAKRDAKELAAMEREEKKQAKREAKELAAIERMHKMKAFKDNVKGGVKDAALAVGKFGYKGVALVAAVGELGLEAGGKFVNSVEDKIAENREARETKKDYKELAKQKKELGRAKLKLGIISFFAGTVKALSEKLSESVLTNEKNVAAKEASMGFKNAQESAREEADGLEM